MNMFARAYNPPTSEDTEHLLSSNISIAATCGHDLVTSHDSANLNLLQGYMDTNGVVRITGRYKELIIGAGGENIAPVPVEEAIKKSAPALSNAGSQADYNESSEWKIL